MFRKVLLLRAIDSKQNCRENGKGRIFQSYISVEDANNICLGPLTLTDIKGFFYISALTSVINVFRALQKKSRFLDTSQKLSCQKVNCDISRDTFFLSVSLLFEPVKIEVYEQITCCVNKRRILHSLEPLTRIGSSSVEIKCLTDKPH